MADPLSITLTVVTLATALKDLIELAQKINESFKKPARNMRAAKALAEETLEIITGLKDFYDGHQEKLDGSPEMRNAVLKLLRDMNQVYDRCRPVLQVDDTSNRRLHAIIKHKFDAWRKRDDLEEHIRNIRDLANKCHRQFTTFALVRIEAATVEIQTTTVQIRSAVADGFARTHVHTSPLRISVDDVVAFMGSNPGILSNLPPHIKLPEHLVYRSCITLQVGKIDKLFKVLASRGSYPIEEPDSLHLKPLRSVISLKPSTDEEIGDVQSDVFALLVKIQDSLKGRDNQPSIQRGAQAMAKLSTGLSNLGMDQESLTIVQFAVDLYRTLAKTNEDAYGPHLAHALGLTSSCYVNIKDVVEAYKVITEAVTLGRRLADANPTFAAQMQLANLVSHSAYVGRRNGDYANSLKDAEEAVQSYQRLIGNPESMLQMEIGIVEGLLMTLEGTHVYCYANALEELHYTLIQKRGHADSSVKAGAEALKMYRGLEQNTSIPGFSDQIAGLCFSLASDEFREIVPVDQAILYAQESVHHYEKILQNTGVIFYNLPFAVRLAVKLLSKMERFDEAYEVCQKFEHMIQIHMDSEQLRARLLHQLIINLHASKCYAKAATTGEHLLSKYRSLLPDWGLFDAYTYTSSSFHRIGDHSKSCQVAEASHSHWGTLAIQNAKYLKYAARSVLILAQVYHGANNYERAFKEGGKALRLFDSLIIEDNTLLRAYKEALEVNIGIAKAAKTELESFKRSRLVLQYSRALVNQFPNQQLFLIRRIRDHAILLCNFNHLTDASVAISEALDWFDVHPAQDSESADLHINCLLESSRFLVQTHPDRVPSLHDKAIAIGQPFLDVRSVAQNILWVKTYNLLAFYYMGYNSTVHDEIRVSLKFSSEHNLEKGFAYTFCLHTVSLLYRCAGRIDDGLVTIQRFIALDREDGTTPSWLLSDLLADAGQEVEALNVAHKAVQETEEWKFSSISYKESHIQAQYCLFLRLFSSGELTQAQELLTQVHSFYEEYSKERSLWFIELAITLWAMCHLECASGRHDEGIAVRTELNELRERLQLVFPSLADLVEVGLNGERNFAAWKRLLEKYDLSCGHQDEEKMAYDNEN